MTTSSTSRPEIERRSPHRSPMVIVLVFVSAGRPTASGGELILIPPAIAEARIGLDMVEIRVHDPELLADALDRRAHIATIALGALAGEEALALHHVVELAI